jgi:hypothetical protein
MRISWMSKNKKRRKMGTIRAMKLRVERRERVGNEMSQYYPHRSAWTKSPTPLTRRGESGRSRMKETRMKNRATVETAKRTAIGRKLLTRLIRT